GRGLQIAGQQVDQCRLAGPVGADQGMARAGRDRQIDVVGGHEAAEAAHQAVSLQDWAHEGVSVRARDRARWREDSIHWRAVPRNPPRANSTTSTRIRPSQSCQYWGFMSDSR